MVMTVGLFKPRKGLARSAKSPMASPREMLDRLRGDVDSLVVAVLDDLTFEVIRAYKNRPPPGYLEWVSVTATRRVRRLARSIFRDRLHEPDAMRALVANWLQPQMEQSFGPLPDGVRDVLCVKHLCYPGADASFVERGWLMWRRRQRQRQQLEPQRPGRAWAATGR
jgi:hypothetical protein